MEPSFLDVSWSFAGRMRDELAECKASWLVGSSTHLTIEGGENELPAAAGLPHDSTAISGLTPVGKVRPCPVPWIPRSSLTCSAIFHELCRIALICWPPGAPPSTCCGRRVASRREVRLGLTLAGARVELGAWDPRGAEPNRPVGGWGERVVSRPPQGGARHDAHV
jgi:hypothetical protein